MRKYFCLALANDCDGFSSDKDFTIAFKRIFTMALELPKEGDIEEKNTYTHSGSPSAIGPQIRNVRPIPTGRKDIFVSWLH